MIIDSLKNSGAIESLHPLFKKAFDYIKSTDFTHIPAGKIELDGDNLFIFVAEINGKQPEEAKMETHIKYLDIQVPLASEETFGWTSLDLCTDCTEAYSAENDIAFFGNKPTTYVTVVPGQFAIFFPEDGHAPGIGNGALRKLIVKVKVTV
ncbi:MAG: YhcH/YjgK/YiaL family protein [Bacteroidales bacterium]